MHLLLEHFYHYKNLTENAKSFIKNLFSTYREQGMKEDGQYNVAFTYIYLYILCLSVCLSVCLSAFIK